MLDGVPGHDNLFAQGISADGRTIVGEDYNVIGCRWREASGYTSLAPLGIAYSSSADGSVIAGQGLNGAFRWTKSAGPQYITQIASGGFAETASDVSSDGSVVVGSGGAVNEQKGIAFRWEETNGDVAIGEYPYGQAHGAQAVNSTGSIVVGSTVIGSVEEAFRWTEKSGLVGLGHLTAHEDPLLAMTTAVAVTDDGTLIIGRETVAPGKTGVFAWTNNSGIRPLDEYLTEKHGIDLTGWALTDVVDMTSDGRFMIGQAMHLQYGQNTVFRISVPEPNSRALAIIALPCTAGVMLRWRRRQSET